MGCAHNNVDVLSSHLVVFFHHKQLILISKMGKLKKGRKSQNRRHNPVARKNGASGKQDSKEETTRQNKIVPLIAKLSSSATNDQSLALSTIGVLAEDEQMRKLLLKERLVATLVEEILSKSSDDELIVEAYGVLRNLTIEEGYDVAMHLWRLKIWTFIQNGLEKIQKSYEFLNSDPKKLDKKRAHLLFDFTENVLSLIVAIASCSEDLYDNIYADIDPVVKLVIDVLNWNIPKLRTSTKLFNALLDFIYEFASDSAAFVSDLAAQESFSLASLEEAVQSSAHAQNNLGKVIVQGIKFHLYEVQSSLEEDKQTACLSILKSIFGTITQLDLEEMNRQLSQKEKLPEPKPADDEKPQNIDIAFGSDSAEKIQARFDLQAIDVTIDLFTTMCEYLAINESHVEESVSLNNELVAFLLDVAFPSCLHLLKYNHEHAQVFQLTVKVLVALNNLCWLFLSNETIPVEWYTKIPLLWDAVDSVSVSENMEVQKLVLSILWALSKSVGPEVRNKVTQAHITGLLEKCTQLTQGSSIADEPVAVYEFLLSAIGFLGSVAQVIGNTDMTREIGEFLLSQIAHYVVEENHHKERKAVEIPFECLNLMYDIFGDAEYDYDLPVFVEGAYLDRLRQLEPAVKTCYKQIDKNRDKDLKIRAEEVYGNLGRFIVYKERERA
ncbi:hypothetical protein CLUG_02845 [Clavispora lusitaniae ATCC 42720]|uniref:SYO1-like TPR repeats domain-containing protein n=2 Tax=Clavispora lusitaniae TaxID=36911 RepID=C4Y2T2_CLAL4|nr:uncharacterized protein CLUG_02845 [Clavispora lusitaniae ATCC 42720]EEQ38720.1 hypothetical protein CLUG_02845 [Clavispora lusitaniae ATCC 42720]